MAKKKTRKRAEIEFTSGDTGGSFVNTEGRFADGSELKHHDAVTPATLHIAIVTPSGRKTIDVPVGSTVTITYG